MNVRASPLGMAACGLLARLMPAAVYVGGDTVLVRTVFGQKLYLDTRDLSIAPCLMVDGFWEKNVTRAYLKLLAPGYTVVEIGANVGYFTSLAALRVGPTGHVIAFEANPHVFGLLKRSIAASGVGNRCQLVEKAVCDVVGAVTFATMPTELGNSHIASSSGVRDGTTTLNVPCTSLDAFFGAAVPRIDIIKIDAEGAEPSIWDGMCEVIARNPGVVIVMEVAKGQIEGAGVDARSFLQGIADRGFGFEVITASGSLRPITVAELAGMYHCDVVIRRR